MAIVITRYLDAPLGYQQFTDLSAAISLANTVPAVGKTGVPAGAAFAVIAVEGAAVRWRDDGVAPVAGVGMPVPAGPSSMDFTANLSTVQFIQDAAGAKLNVSYYSNAGFYGQTK